MNMKKLFCIGLIGILALSFVGCRKDNKDSATNDKTTSIEDSKNKNKSDGANKLSANNGDNEKDPKEEANPSTENSGDTEKPEEVITPPAPEPAVTPPAPTPAPQPDPTPEAETPVNQPDNTERVFKIVSKNSDWQIVDGGEIRTVGLGVAENIREILSTVSSNYFGGTGIELSTIETINSQKIAVINLTGDESYWHQQMQGSTGGHTTQYTLVENVLQRQYTGYWIDGVRFTLNGQLLQDIDHAPALSQTTYR